MRFLSASALEKALKFRLAASCSAADAIARAPLFGLLGRGCCGLLRRRADDRHRAPRLLDRGPRSRRRARDLEGELRLELTVGQDAHAVAIAADQAGGLQRR